MGVIVLLGLLCIGYGPNGCFVSPIVLLYGLLSRHIIMTHPQCGSWFVTTDPEFHLTDDKDMIQPADKFACDAVLAVVKTLNTTAFQQFEERLGPVKIMQAMMKIKEEDAAAAAEA